MANQPLKLFVQSVVPRCSRSVLLKKIGPINPGIERASGFLVEKD